jgi:hypothetical protein
MKKIILVLTLCTSLNVFAQENGEVDKPVDYGALTNSLQYLGTKWVDEPAARDQQIRLQQIQANQTAPTQPVIARSPVCYTVPQYSVISGQIMGNRTICQ